MDIVIDIPDITEISKSPNIPKRNDSFFIKDVNIAKITIILILISFIIILCFFSWYEQVYDNDKQSKNIFEIIGINIGLSIGGVMLSILSNYLSERYTMRDLDKNIKKITDNYNEKMNVSMENFNEMKNKFIQTHHSSPTNRSRLQKEAIKSLENLRFSKPIIED